jgi:hypothetical protein
MGAEKKVRIPFFNDRHKADFYNIPVNELTKYGLRFGGGDISQPVFTGERLSLLHDFVGYRTTDPQKKLYDLKGPFATNLGIGYVYAGISYERVRDFVINLNNPYAGQSKESNRRQLYMDVIYAPRIAYSEINVPKGNAVIPFGTYDINNENSKSRFGLRLGYTMTSFKKYNMETYEIGYLPGPKVMGFYFLVKGGLSFSL